MSLLIRARPPVNPALAAHLDERAKRLENRIANLITTFVGSMPFIYVHIIWFTLLITLRVEPYPYGLLTMIVSLEAIFLSTFVMIFQNRADEKRKVLADNEWQTVQLEQRQNEELIDISNQILNLTKEVHRSATASNPGTEAQ